MVHSWLSRAESLLQQTAQLNREHAARAQEERRAFNVFSMLRAEDDEVNLHSRFLFELLNPQGTHGMGTAFLERFLAQAGLETFDVTTATVQREIQNMDIFIANAARQAVILENKIFAPDQPKQLQRYYRAVRKEGYRDVKVLYLTPYGDAPSADSAGNLDAEILTLISYADDVRDWLADCIENIPLPPTIHMTLMQYQWLVEELTGQAGGRLLMNVKTLLKDEDSLAAAISISQALIETGFHSKDPPKCEGNRLRGRKVWVARVFAGWGGSKSSCGRSKAGVKPGKKHSKSGERRSQSRPQQFGGEVAVSLRGKWRRSGHKPDWKSGAWHAGIAQPVNRLRAILRRRLKVRSSAGRRGRPRGRSGRR